LPCVIRIGICDRCLDPCQSGHMDLGTIRGLRDLYLKGDWLLWAQHAQDEEDPP
jgi:hypothetical protein